MQLRLASVDDPQNKRKDHADQKARYQREVEYRVLAPDNDIARQMPQPDGKLFAERNKHPERRYQQSQSNQDASQAHTLPILTPGVRGPGLTTLDARCAKVNVRPEVMI